MDFISSAEASVPALAMLASFLVFFGGTMFSLGGFRKDLLVVQAEIKSMTTVLIKQQALEIRITSVEERARERYAEVNARIDRVEHSVE